LRIPNIAMDTTMTPTITAIPITTPMKFRKPDAID
jgi:hypothetical protein